MYDTYIVPPNQAKVLGSDFCYTNMTLISEMYIHVY